MTHKYLAILSLLMATSCDRNLGSEAVNTVTLKKESIKSDPASTTESFQLSGDGMAIVTDINGEKKICQLAERAMTARPSFDRKALILSDSTYIDVDSIRECQSPPLTSTHIPESAGILGDVNISQNIYVGLTLISTQPWAYVATVARLDSEDSLVNLPGAYSSSKTDSELEKESFPYAESEGPFSIISPDGRYVAPDGIISCTPDAYVGVWDISKEKKVIIADGSTDRDRQCNDLFNIRPK